MNRLILQAFVRACVVLVVAVTASWRSLGWADAQSAVDIVELISNEADLSNFTAALAGPEGIGDGLAYDATSSSLLNYTVFAPTDAAYADFATRNLTMLMTDPSWNEHYNHLVAYHVVPGTFRSSDLIDGMVLSMLNGEEITVQVDESTGAVTLSSAATFFVTAAAVTTIDLEATNGIVHKIDRVLTPAFVEFNVLAILVQYNCSTFSTLIREANVGPSLELAQATILAPTDAALAAMDASVLDALRQDVDALAVFVRNHVLNGVVPRSYLETTTTQPINSLGDVPLTVAINPIDNTLSVNGANIVQTDIFASNGMVHVLDGVLLTEAGAPVEEPIDTTLPDETNVTSATPTTDLLGLANTTIGADYSTLFMLIEMLNLGPLLATAGNITMWAPNDNAFARLGNETLNALLSNNALLTQLLSSHVVLGLVRASDMVSGSSLPTLAGSSLNFEVDFVDGSILVNGQALVVQADVLPTNGIVHGIDAVLFPELYGAPGLATNPNKTMAPSSALALETVSDRPSLVPSLQSPQSSLTTASDVPSLTPTVVPTVATSNASGADSSAPVATAPTTADDVATPPVPLAPTGTGDVTNDANATSERGSSSSPSTHRLKSGWAVVPLVLSLVWLV